jgi:hypothetical protein
MSVRASVLVRAFVLGTVIALLCPTLPMCAWEAEDYEEPAGASFAILVGPADEWYGISFGSGVWLKDSPVFGDYFVRLFHSGSTDTWYSGVGMTIRLMPRTVVAPFVGAGGSYNYAFSEASTNETAQVVSEDADHDRSFWAGHVEAGCRVWIGVPWRLLEVFGRQSWTSLDDTESTWLIGISTGAGF